MSGLDDDPLFGDMFTINTPMPYPGTHADIARNIASHTFDDGYCDRCGSKPHHVAASWPCGDDPDRVGFEVDPHKVVR